MFTKMLIGQGFVEGQGEAEVLYAPATGDVIMDLPEASPAQVNAAVAAATAAFPAWALTAPAERSARLLRVADGIEREAETLARVESLNTGKPLPLIHL